MSWLEEVEYEYRYLCPEGHLSIFESRTCDREPRLCLDCGSLAEYDGFNPLQLGMIGKVSYEQNGRRAFRVTDGKGMVHHISETKQHYMDTGNIKPAYSREYEASLRKAGRDDLLQGKKGTDLIKERAAVQRAKVKMARTRPEKGETT